MDLLTTWGAALILKISPSTVRLWSENGRLACTRASDGTRLFARDEVERIASQRAAGSGR